METSLADPASETFAGCAPFYDALTAHHDYESLARTLEQLLADHGHSGRRMLDAACGTGKSFLPFVQRGYEVVATDISSEMLELARAKADGAAEVVLADMRSLPVLGAFDLVTCIDEPLNYLLEPDDVGRALASFSRNLRAGGLLVFDVNTLHAFRSIFARDECYEQVGWLFVWRGHGDGATPPGGRSGFTIEAFTEEDGRWVRFTNQHVQQHHPAPELTGLLAAAGLECLGMYGMSPDGVLDPAPDEHRHTKRFYVARKPLRSEGR